MIDLDAIRKRDAADMEILPALEDTALCIDDEELRNAIHMVRDRNGLLTYIDKLREAAGKVTDTYDAYRRRGVLPAPKEYADVVRAIDDLRALLTPEVQK